MDIPEYFSKELVKEIFESVFASEGFIRLTQSVKRNGKSFKISIRPITLRGESLFQAEMIDDGKTEVRNLSAEKTREGIEKILNQNGARELHLITNASDLHVKVTKKEKVMVSRGIAKSVKSEMPNVSHDRVKKQPLNAFDSTALLKAIGIADVNGLIKPSMRGKYDQVNELLREVDNILPETNSATIVDCGCGKAYLTISVYAYLTYAKNKQVKVYGIDKNHAVISSAEDAVEKLGFDGNVFFQACTIAEADIPKNPTLIMSLHACDTATDDALIAAVKLNAERILCVPCCQHELHNALNGGGAMKAVLRHGILRERLADLLTDTFRSQVLRIMGYRTRVMEFISPEATARNILIRAERSLRPGLSEAISEYESLKEFWGVSPYIGEKLLPLVKTK